MIVRRQGDVEGPAAIAVAALFQDLYSPLLGLAVVLTNDRELAEDLTQEAFARLLRSWDRLRDPNAAAAYLRSTLVNLARSSLRRRRVRIRKNRALVVDPDVAADPADRVAVVRALRALPFRQRTCIALRFYEGLSSEEVARVMETSVGTVKSQTHKALRRLEQLLEEP